MNILDDDGKIKQLDTLNMLAIEENFADQLAEAQKIGAAADITGIRGRNFAGIAFLGMGGSGFTGDIIKSLLINRSEIPIVVIKGYSLPAYAVSYTHLDVYKRQDQGLCRLISLIKDDPVFCQR